MRTIAPIAFDRIFAFGDPGAVAGLVVFGVILSANHQAFRTWTHIGQEIGEFVPGSIHPDSLGPIPFKLSAIRIVATLLNASPANVCGWSFLVFWGAAMRSLVGISSLATTAFCNLIAQGQGFYFSFFPAHTLTKPQGPSIALVHASVFKHFPRSEYLAAQIDQLFFRHPPTLAY